MELLKDRISKVMGVTGWNAARLAKETGLSKASITFWVNGTTATLKAGSAQAISKKTGFSTDWLISGKLPMMISSQTLSVSDHKEISIERALDAIGVALAGMPGRDRATLVSKFTSFVDAPDSKILKGDLADMLKTNYSAKVANGTNA